MEIIAAGLSILATLLLALSGLLYWYPSMRRHGVVIFFAAWVLYGGTICLLLWQKAAKDVAVAPPPELHGELTPSNEPNLNHPCLKRMKPPASSVGLFYGDSAAWITDSVPKFVLLQIEGDELLSITKKASGISVSANIFSTDGRIVAQIIDNNFHVNPNNYFRIENGPSSLVVYDQYAKAVLNVRFLNPRSVQILGVFHHPILDSDSPIIIDEQGVWLAHSKAAGIRDLQIGGNCTVGRALGIWFSKGANTKGAIMHFALQ